MTAILTNSFVYLYKMDTWNLQNLQLTNGAHGKGSLLVTKEQASNA